jgi:prepilin-type N-terminal cleavage/methylation domain-containing protein
MRRPLAILRSGFTLIELLAVMLIIGILATFLLPNIMTAFEQTRVTACRSSLSTIGQGLLSYQTKFKKMPTHDGALFFCCLITEGVWENTEQNAKRLTCPEVPYEALDGLRDREPEEWFTDNDEIDGTFSAYAGRNTRDYPFRRRTLSGKEVLVADDNDGGANHPTTTLALMGDYSVREYEIVDLQNRNLVDEEVEILDVGPNSPLEELQKLSLD